MAVYWEKARPGERVAVESASVLPPAVGAVGVEGSDWVWGELIFTSTQAVFRFDRWIQWVRVSQTFVTNTVVEKGVINVTKDVAVVMCTNE